MHLMTMQHALEHQYLHPATTDFVEIKMSDQASDFGTPFDYSPNRLYQYAPAQIPTVDRICR